MRTLVRDLYIYYDTDKEEYCEELSSEITTLESYLKDYESTISDSQNQENYNNVQIAFESYKSSVGSLLNIAESGKSVTNITKS